MWLMVLIFAAGPSDTLRLTVAPAETLQVTVAGNGVPAVLVPGVFGSAFGYRKLTRELVDAGYRVLVVEPLGIGYSSRPAKADYSLTTQADRIAAALDSLAVSSAVVVAHSLGGSMGFRLAYRRPDLVRALVLLEGGPEESAATPGLRNASRLAGWIKLLGVGALRGSLRKSLIKASGDPSWVTDSVVDEYVAGPGRDLDGTLRALVRMVDAKEPERLEPRLPDIKCPVRLLIGLMPHPESMKPKTIALLADRLPRFVVDSLPTAGHWMHEEQPARVAAAVRAAHRAGDGEVAAQREATP